MTLFIGADLASCTGLCAGRGNETPAATAWQGPTTGDDYGTYGLAFLGYFLEYLRFQSRRIEGGEGVIINYEAPLFPRPAWNQETRKLEMKTTPQTMTKLNGLRMIFETAVEMVKRETGAAIEMYECNLASMKSELSGKGGSSKTEMVLAAQRAGIQLPPGKEAEDAADGFAAWLMAVRLKGSRADGEYWDKRLHGGLFRLGR